jgi:uncharacterized membrane protein YphA (DoxX/SURF4 family)
VVSLPVLIVSFAIIGAVFTFLTKWSGKTKNTFWTFLQHFCGVWFVFSGLVKAVDPIGTAYKMEDYFAAFAQTAEGLTNVFKGIAPVFPFLAKYSLGFSTFMIVLEIALGVMLVIGYNRKWTVWLFFITMVFFTALTGFTFLTGYVPTEANFFDFAKWGPYIKSQMRVTDCGCFGDFIKLDPKISFFKDLGLMIPAFLFLLGSKNMHQLWTKGTRNILLTITILGSLALCYRNAYMNLPMVDFRPFKIGTNLRERFALEKSAQVDILGWVLENDSTKQVIKFMEPEAGKITYYKTYPKNEGWKVKDQIQTDWYVEKDGQKMPITKTKINEFAVEDAENGEVTDALLEEKGYSMMIVAYKLKGEKKMETFTVQDTVFATDTIRVNKDSVRFERKIASVTPRTVERESFIPTPEYGALFRDQLNPLADAAAKAGWKVYAITTIGDATVAADFKTKVGATYPFYKADDKLLKTILRANPGVVILKDGVVVDMFHDRHLPKFEDINKM